jgi:exodeoxyribonuclease VIII
MLDLETMGNGPNAAIVSLGAVRFCLRKLELLDEFYEVISLASSQSLGGTIDASTVMWWLQQASEAQQALYASNLTPPRTLPEVLQKFTAWVGGNRNEVAVWGNGATFDNVILHSAYKACGHREPWTYKNDLCFRTLRRLFPTHYTPQGVKHNALDDARNQAQTVLKVVDMLRHLGDDHGEADWFLQGGESGGLVF